MPVFKKAAADLLGVVAPLATDAAKNASAVGADVAADALGIDTKGQEKDGGELVRQLKEKKNKEAEKKQQRPPKGDYRIQVHIIEGKEFKSHRSSKTINPVAKIELKIGTQVKHAHTAKVKTECTAHIFDDVLVFDVPNCTVNELEAASIKISLFDSGGANPFQDDLIGSYSFDLMNIYSQNNHEMYKQWFAIADIQNLKGKGKDENGGVQGYLQSSLIVLGPNDQQKIHHEDEDEVDKAVLIPSYLEQNGKTLSINVFQVAGLPEMDADILAAKGNNILTYLDKFFFSTKYMFTFTCMCDFEFGGPRY